MNGFFGHHSTYTVPATHLIHSTEHPPLLVDQRAQLLLKRVHLLALLFAAFTFFWLLIDVLVFPRNVWLDLTGLRVLVCIAFLILTRYPPHTRTLPQARLTLGLVLLVALVFYLLAQPLVQPLELNIFGQIIAATYDYIPFVIMACLAMLPLTVLEGLLFSIPILAAHVGLALFGSDTPQWTELSASWLLFLIGLIVTVSATAQLQYMLALTQRSSRDPLTGAYNRETGAELLDMQFHNAIRQGAPLALAFFDIDDFKSINDRFGHETGDEVLQRMAQTLHVTLRGGDTLIRWGGEEFLIMLPNTDCATAQHALQRIYTRGFGTRPDGQPLTASAGISELGNDRATGTHELVEHADRRMYAAKRAGKNRFIGCGSTGNQLEADQ